MEIFILVIFLLCVVSILMKAFNPMDRYTIRSTSMEKESEE